MAMSQSHSLAPVRPAWLADTIRDCQSFPGHAVEFIPSDLAVQAGHFVTGLSQPLTPLERLTQKGLLLDLAVHFGHTAHKLFHAGPLFHSGTLEACDFRSGVFIEEWPDDVRVSPSNAFLHWAVQFGEGFQAAHRFACAHAAAHLVRRNYRNRIGIEALSHRLRCAPKYLQRTFRALTGMTLLEFRGEIQRIEAMRLLAVSDAKIEVIAREVGYQSKKDLYRAIRTHRHCTPLEFRQRARASSELEITGR